MITDRLLRVPLHRLADARSGRLTASLDADVPGGDRASAHVYEFAWPSNVPGLGACHALELGFVFDTAGTPDSAKLAGEGAPQELADAMHGAWVRFAVDGDPGWAAWDASHPVRIFGAGEPHTVHGPRDRELALWEAESARAAARPTTSPAARPADGLLIKPADKPAGKPVDNPAGSVEGPPTSLPPVEPSGRTTTPLSAVRRFRRSGGADRP
jgi:para-nitrobenzyl esterase